MKTKEKVLKGFTKRKAYEVIVDETLSEVEKVIDELSFKIKDKRLMDVVHVFELKQKLGIK